VVILIEREIIKQKKKQFLIQKFISENLKRVGHSSTKLVKTPLGEKVIIYASRPGLIVGRKGQNIKNFTKVLEREFNLENPQIEIIEVENIYLDPNIVAENIATALEQYGTSGFKGVGHKAMADVMNAGALGVEILISGKIPGARAKTWRFYQGYLKKCGDPAISGVKVAYCTAQLKTGTIGIQVRIMPPDLRLPDSVIYNESYYAAQPVVEDVEKTEQTSSDESVLTATDDVEDDVHTEAKEAEVEKSKDAASDTAKDEKKKIVKKTVKKKAAKKTAKKKTVKKATKKK